MKKTKLSMVQLDEVIESKIFLIRGKKVMLDRDLARLYGVDTRRLNQQGKEKLKKLSGLSNGFPFKINMKRSSILLRELKSSGIWPSFRCANF